MSSLNTSNQAQAAAAAAAKTYVEWRDAFPAAEPTVRIIFHGLFCFFFDGKDECHVGTHNTTRQPGHPHNTHPHDYQVTVTQMDGGAVTDRFTHMIGNPQRFPRINFRTTGSAFPGGVAPGAYVYTGPNHAQFNRNPGDDPKDWRWIIDFEDRMYPGGVKGINAAALRAGMRIDNGLFYTKQRTSKPFDLLPEGGGAPIPLNNIAEIVAANIYLAEGGFVKLTGGGPVLNERKLEYAPNRTFEVEILNLCDGNAHTPCQFEPTSPDKQKRNDFFLYYDTFDRLQNRPEYLLILRTPGLKSKDDTPCGAVGFGQTPEP